MQGVSSDDVLHALPDNLLEDLQSNFRDFFEWSNPCEPDKWDLEIPCLTERFILNGKWPTICHKKR
jgi:hypothetical protein